MPTTAYDTISVAGLRPSRAGKWRAENFKFPNSTTIVAGTVLGEITASPGSVKAYASGNVDGSQNPIGLAQYDVTVDASGNHTWGGATVAGETRPYAPVYVKGYFNCADLTGLDATALTNGKKLALVNGTVSAGEIVIMGA